MFAKETYVQRRARLKKTIGSGVLLFLGNDEQGLNYEDNTFRYRQDSTFLYYFGLSFADPDFSGSKDPARLSAARTIHNYFFLKSLDAVREGGIVAFITSQKSLCI